jgi:hypothetical protein
MKTGRTKTVILVFILGNWEQDYNSEFYNEEDAGGSQKTSDLYTEESPMEIGNIDNEKHTDIITNDLFYEILAEVITDPIPRRDLSVFNFAGPSSRKLVNSTKRKPFELLAVEKYLEEVIESIMENESSFIDNLLEPVRRNPLDMLQLLQNSDLGSYEHFENISLKQPVLNLDLYLDIERNKEEQRLTEKANLKIMKHLDTNLTPNESSTDDEELIEFEQIHRKMIFDWINEAINKYRPYGEEGVPMPWASSIRRLCSNDILNFEKVFNGIKDNLFKWGTSQAGIMPSQDYWIGNDLDEEFFSDVREKRLAELLSNEVHEVEGKWLKYEFEESQVKIDITDMILEDMIEEICIVLNSVEGNDKKGLNGASIFQIIPIELIEMEEQRKAILERIKQESVIDAIFK